MGGLGKKKRVQVGSVLAGLRHVGQTFKLAGHPDPRRPPSSKELHLAISRLLSTYWNADPATKSQIALPVEVIAGIMQHEGVSDSPGVRAAADLILVAVYYLLRVGEYTKPTGKCVTRTTQFRLQDVTFWKDTGNGNLLRLPFNVAEADILAASAAILTLDNEKNAVRDRQHSPPRGRARPSRPGPLPRSPVYPGSQSDQLANRPPLPGLATVLCPGPGNIPHPSPGGRPDQDHGQRLRYRPDWLPLSVGLRSDGPLPE
jgi:hypothetical protein